MDAQKQVRRAADRLPFRGRYGATSERVSLESLGLHHPDRVPNSASPWWVLRWLLPRSEVGPGDVFVEFGCGKGESCSTLPCTTRSAGSSRVGGAGSAARTW